MSADVGLQGFTIGGDTETYGEKFSFAYRACMVSTADLAEFSMKPRRSVIMTNTMADVDVNSYYDAQL